MVFSKLRLISVWLLLVGAVPGVGLPSAAEAQVPLTPRDRVIAALEDQGYQVTRVRTTWLGRVQIRARSGDLRREIVLNPASGEILRDYVESIGRGSDRSGGRSRDDDDSSGGADDNDNSDRSDDDDDDSSEDDDSSDDDDDDDNGGSSDDDDSDDDDDDDDDSR